jgi:hypothetical protein
VNNKDGVMREHLTEGIGLGYQVDMNKDGVMREHLFTIRGSGGIAVEFTYVNQY